MKDDWMINAIYWVFWLMAMLCRVSSDQIWCFWEDRIEDEIPTRMSEPISHSIVQENQIALGIF